MKEKLTQNEIVLNALEHGEIIDCVWGIENFILRLSARINDLKNLGHKIESVKLTNKKGKQLRYCGYKLV